MFFKYKIQLLKSPTKYVNVLILHSERNNECIAFAMMCMLLLLPFV